MKQHAEILYNKIEVNSEYESIINKVIEECFVNEYLDGLKLYVSITLTVPEEIHILNKTYRNIDNPTDVLSFPMFQPDEIKKMIKNNYQKEDVLGDMVISIPQVENQAKEYGHTFERELAYMVVHSFYHLMGYDHMEEDEKTKMRAKEDEILNKLNITRED